MAAGRRRGRRGEGPGAGLVDVPVELGQPAGLAGGHRLERPDVADLDADEPASSDWSRTRCPRATSTAAATSACWWPDAERAASSRCSGLTRPAPRREERQGEQRPEPGVGDGEAPQGAGARWNACRTASGRRPTRATVCDGDVGRLLLEVQEQQLGVTLADRPARASARRVSTGWPRSPHEAVEDDHGRRVVGRHRRRWRPRPRRRRGRGRVGGPAWRRSMATRRWRPYTQGRAPPSGRHDRAMRPSSARVERSPSSCRASPPESSRARATSVRRSSSRSGCTGRPPSPGRRRGRA